MKEIGGYFEFEKLTGQEYYNLLAFNTVRNALRYIIKKRKIKELYMPIFLCESVYKACLKEKVNVNFYHIDDKFNPIINNQKCNSYVLVVNYYGILNNNNLKMLNKKFKNIIVDNTHSFFQKPIKGVDTLYNCRKYFGVPDGAYLSTTLGKDNLIGVDKSASRFKHLFGRLENTASEYYKDFCKTDDSFNEAEVKYMSKTTHNILRAINYKTIKQVRINNFKYLNSMFKSKNKLKINRNLTFMYPLYLDSGSKIREELINKKIYVPKLWPNIPSKDSLSLLEKDFINNIVLLPIDQRYTIEDMKYICKNLKGKL